MSKKRILFVPQTLRNKQILLLYAKALLKDFDVFFLRTRLLGVNSNIGDDTGDTGIQLLTPEFLMRDIPDGARLYRRMIIQKSLHQKFKDYLSDLNLSLVITGVDDDGMGQWATCLAKENSIATLTCQEGLRLFKFKFPFEVKFKYHLNNLISGLFYPPAKIRSLYSTADYAAVWGEYDKKIALANGKNDINVYIVGNPRDLTNAQHINRPIGSPFKILFLDFPSTSFPKNTFNLSQFSVFRQELLEVTKSLGCRLIYKTHPFIRKDELAFVRKQVSSYSHVELVEEGIAEDLLSRSDVCLTLPSTAVASILISGLPFIQVYPFMKGFRKLLWDPVIKYGAGVSIDDLQDLSGALNKIKEPVWQNSYQKASKIAAEEVFGPLDGKASDRFAAVVKKILSENKS